MNKVTVLFFASLREQAGVKQVELELAQPTSVGELRALLAQRLPGLEAALRASLAAVNSEYALDDELIPAGAEVALFPPVSGGGAIAPTIIAITEDELDLNALLEQITLASTGAACVFSGMVRGETSRGEPHETAYLEYEAYQPMAEAKLRQVAGEIRARWPEVQGIAIVQRVGRLYPRTPTVLVACSAAHRDTGVFDAARYAIDRLKEIVPVWKKEVGPQGEAWVAGEYIPKRGD